MTVGLRRLHRPLSSFGLKYRISYPPCTSYSNYQNFLPTRALLSILGGYERGISRIVNPKYEQESSH